ncbi:CorA family divalent cation transporter [Sphingomonas canadensis]|uniref:CorA family divalent cation transporter n=1 Tax=Sphingomonas canadensis TaxID=1219257 RepID=A0ABW3H2D5_9SPHN|nr:CorA family divalent cation transporter [Sphingomonas canadensis]MCW3834808.1 zinc transporter ZntB [Sphingomonas canadensis]
MTGFAWIVHDGAARQIPLEEAPGADGDLVWVHLTTNNEHAQQWLDEQAHLSPFVIEALTAAETRPRCDAVEDGAVINLRGLSSEQLTASDPLASVRIHARHGRVFSVTRNPLNAMDRVCADLAVGEIHDPGDLIAAIADEITEELDPMVAKLGDSLDACETRIGNARAFQLRRLVNQVRSQAIGYRRFLNPQRAALEKLALLPGKWLRDDDRLKLGAAADRAARMAEELESIRERAALTHETLTDLRTEQIDQRSLIIAIVAMVFLPLTFVTGLLGMNVAGIPFAHEPWAFWGETLFCVAIALGVTGYFVGRHWFR